MAANGHSHKKIKTRRKAQQACTLSSLIALSHTSAFFRTMVKTLYRIRLIAVVEPFIGHENIKTFFDVLEASNSAIGGSAIPRMLTPPLREDEDWMPSNLNIYIPLGGMRVGGFFAAIRLELSSQQPGIARLHKFVTNGFVQYESRLPGHPIMLSESIDACVITQPLQLAPLSLCILSLSFAAVPIRVGIGRTWRVVSSFMQLAPLSLCILSLSFAAVPIRVGIGRTWRVVSSFKTAVSVIPSPLYNGTRAAAGTAPSFGGVFKALKASAFFVGVDLKTR
ncbi:hypothetical protein B0H14DRAFT_2593919 [Mycena olivaceomarginata]|nr:hypothetical protein B0H14DRAFT_2593919 [Mycena olivaceomarginata]